MGETARISSPSIRRPARPPQSTGFDPGKLDPRRLLGMLVVATRLGSAKARAALTLIIFLAVWLLLSIPDAFAASTVTRSSSFTYDADGLLLTETVEPNDETLGVKTTYTYDSYGNKLSATTADIDADDSQGPLVNIASRSTTAVYATEIELGVPNYGRFATSTINALGHTESAVTDPKFGVTKSQTGPNNLTTTWQYDSFGRVTLEVRPDGNRTAYSYEYCAGVNGGTLACPAGAYMIQATPQNSSGAQNAAWVKTYYDTHGRKRATDTQGFAGSTVRQWTIYDAMGRTWKESRPYYVASASPVYTVFAYDALGRTTTITLADGSVSTNGYNALTTTATNDLGQTETTVKNARGEIVSVTDANLKTTYFTYDAFGNRTSIKDSANNVQTMTYDKAGRKTAGVDPDLGSWTYAYNVLGELVEQIDAKGQTTTMTYDLLGRPTSRIEPGLTSNWAYDAGTAGIGKLSTASTSDGYLKTLGYDSLGRPITTAIRSETGASTFTTTTTYSNASRISTIAYPSGLTVKHLYNPRGYLTTVQEYGGAQIFWTANAVDAEGRVTQETAGNGVVTNRAFDQNNGNITTIQAGPSNAVANLAFTFDAIGNLTQRTDWTQNGANGLVENFTYDVLNRLKTYNIVGGLQKSVAYNDIGNITSKSDVGLYTYAAAGTYRPHAAVATSGGTLQSATSYDYDANGAMITGAGRTTTWTAFNKVASIAKGTTAVSWGYDPEHQRSKQVTTSGGTTNTTFYFDDAASGVSFERVEGPSLTTWNDYLFAGGQRVGVHIARSDSTTNTRYFVTDHLGSVAVITDETGVVAERLAYDAWGKRRYPNGNDDTLNILTASATTRGFTDHEMIDELDLVNMNGRVYDPTIGRFMSADPFIHDVTNSQDLNRYSYVHNNPLSYTDMNGYGFFKTLGKIFKGIVKAIIKLAIAAAVTAILGPVLGPIAAILPAGVQPYFIAGVGNGITDVIFSGRAKAFGIGFGKGALRFGVGEVFGHAIECKVCGDRIGASISHGVIDGLAREAQGGSFFQGFLTSGFSSFVGAWAPEGFWQGYAFYAAAGGTANVLGGGKFSDGVANAAGIYLYNETGLGGSWHCFLDMRCLKGFNTEEEAAESAVESIAGAEQPPTNYKRDLYANRSPRSDYRYGAWIFRLLDQTYARSDVTLFGSTNTPLGAISFVFGVGQLNLSRQNVGRSDTKFLRDRGLDHGYLVTYVYETYDGVTYYYRYPRVTRFDQNSGG